MRGQLGRHLADASEKKELPEEGSPGENHERSALSQAGGGLTKKH